ncbi:hypothetical protein T492DRAFT_840494 [Pavlovales sp. CCMP2436]|nr:hypothetical protein T492DRAFT_840494 [Pavlovales sp. CCMP2436]
MGEIEYYRFFIDRTDMAVNVTVTAYSGDPDIYASFTQERPTVADHTFSSTAFGGDSLSISHFDERFCAAASCSLHIGVLAKISLIMHPSPICAATSCSLHIGVLGASESRFSVVASQREETRLVLLDGMPQHAALGGGEWQYYTFTVRA